MCTNSHSNDTLTLESHDLNFETRNAISFYCHISSADFILERKKLKGHSIDLPDIPLDTVETPGITQTINHEASAFCPDGSGKLDLCVCVRVCVCVCM